MILLKIISISIVLCLCDSYHKKYVIPAAIHTRHSVDIRPVENSVRPQIPSQLVRVDGTQLSVIFKFKSSSSHINVVHKHESAKVPAVQQSNSVDEPHILSHTVNTPIIQEVREVISPFRHVIQEVRPVVQIIETIVNTNREGHRSETINRPKDLNLIEDKRKPLMDLTLKDSLISENIIDYSLYSGTSKYDLKYISPNIELLNNKFNKSFNNYLLFERLRLYRDRK